MIHVHQSASEAWQDTIFTVMRHGCAVNPRGKLTTEIASHTVSIDMRRPVLRVPSRKINYKFMAAEAYWILSGDARVSTIAPYNSQISKFSDDGQVFFGAYGPKIMSQIDYVVTKLVSDKDSRQAGLTIWRENPPATKDVPCTVAMFFSIRGGFLHCHVFMRSSDVWLGLPYDMFTFSMVSHFVCTHLNARGLDVSPGNLYLTAASSHVYEENWVDASHCARDVIVPQPETPAELLDTLDSRFPADGLMTKLAAIADSISGDGSRWWEET
jgi:thymidylate synthase